MMRNILILVSMLFLCNISFAQTKVIFHKSHSGNAANFSTALEASFLGFGKSDFGEAPIEIIRTANLDSLISLSDSTVVMVTREVCNKENFIIGEKDTTVWKEGRDTILHSPYFSNTKTKEEIRDMLDKRFFFVNPASTVVLIGYDETRKMKPEIQEETKPEVKPEDKKLPVLLSPDMTKKFERRMKRVKKKQIRKEMKAEIKAAKKEAKKKIKALGDVEEDIPSKNLPKATAEESAMRWGTVSVLGLLLAMLGMTFWKLRKQ